MTTNNIVTELFLATNFAAKSGITPGSDNIIGMDCNQITARYNVSISGISATGVRLPGKNQIAGICPAIGDSYNGGIVAYIFQSGDNGYVSGECHGIIAAPTDTYISVPWGAEGLAVSTSFDLKTAEANSANIISLNGDGYYAAKLLYDLTLNGFSDWLLPSYNDLVKLYLNRSAIGYFTNTATYWSSSEYGQNHGAGIKFDAYVAGSIYGFPKTFLCRARAIRYF